uniref:Aldehyde dehydrogenase 16 family, member A1 n=1 Tax=Hucho hucho TaxID=62062 RepID=A0A4W5P8T2_9TELE
GIVYVNYIFVSFSQAWLEPQSRALGLFIAGKFVQTDMQCGTVCSTVCAVDEDVSLCVSSGVSGFKAWSALPCHLRAKTLLRLVNGLQKHGQCLSEQFYLAQSPCSPSALVRLLQYYSDWAQLRDSLIPDWTPRGVVEVVVSDDCSLYSLMLKVLPALAMGMTHTHTHTHTHIIYIYIYINSAKNTRRSAVRPAYITCRLMKEPLSLSPPPPPPPLFRSLSLFLTLPPQCQWMLCVQESVWDSVVSVPLLAEGDRRLVDAAVQEAQQQRATLIQACPPPSSSTAYPPTVLCGVAPSCTCVVTPSPGPLLPLLSFRSHGEGVTLGNHSPHGQAASIWTEDLTLALEAAKSLSVGSVWVNSHSVMDPSLPLSGHKESGNCIDGGKEGLFQFLRPSSSPPLPRSSPASVDYSKFGTAASAAIIPEGSNSSSTPRSYLQYVGGKQCKSESGSSVFVLASGGTVLAYCPDGGRKDVRNAVEAAIKVQPGFVGLLARTCFFSSAHTFSMGLRSGLCDGHSNTLTLLSFSHFATTLEVCLGSLSIWKTICDQVLQSSDLPGGVVSIITGGRDQLTQALANHSVVKAIWYWGSMEGCQFLQHTCSSTLKSLWLHCQEEDGGRDWAQPHPSIL